MNNPIQLIATDPSPLKASQNALKALDEYDNVYQWLMNEVTSYTSRPSLTHDDISHKVMALMGVKMVAKTNNRMVENVFGLALNHAMTPEPIMENFKLAYIYDVDRTDAGRCSYMSHMAPSVDIVRVERKISSPEPTRVNIRVNKDVYKQITEGMGAVEGSWLTKKKERAVMGLDATNPLADPSLHLAATEFNNFFAHIDVRLNAAANSLTRGQNTQALLMMVEQSPSVTTLPRNTRFKNVLNRKELVRRQLSIVPQMAFGLNKMTPLRTADRNSVSAVMGEIVQIFDLHTEATGAIDGLEGWFDGPKAPFAKPDAIAFSTVRAIQKMETMGLVNSETVNMHQIMTVLTLSQEDTHPMREMVPQKSVTMKNGSYVRNPDTQLAKREVTTGNIKINYSKVGNKNVVFVPVDDGVATDEIAAASQLTTMSTFDFVLPSGITFTQHGSAMHGPSRQGTTFANELGARYTLSCSQVKTFLFNFFSDHSTATYDGTGFKDLETALSCMMFYKHAGDPDVDYDFSLERCEMMRDNYFYDNDVMANNVIYVMLNRTTPSLQTFFELANGGRKIRRGDLIDLEESNDDDDDCRRSSDREDFNKDLVKAIVENYLTKNKMPFSEKDFNKIYATLYNLKNYEAIEFVGDINMGFGVCWVKPMHVQADGMMLCRPSGYAHFGGVPMQRRSNDQSDEFNSVLIDSVAYSTTSRQSISMYPSVMWSNAMYIESATTTTNKVVNVIDPSDITDALNHLRTTEAVGLDKKTFDPEIREDGWWPLFTPPKMDIEAMSKPFSPLGRMGTQFKSEEDHERGFIDTNVMDAVHPNVYTTNAVHQDMWNNFNVNILYDKDLFHNPDFPFYKYIHFNPTADESLRATEDAITRDTNRKINIHREDSEGVRVKGEACLSHVLGAAIPKTCWSDTELGGVMSREDFRTATSYRVNAILTKGSTGFYINGDDFVGKWDRCGLSEYAFI